MMPVERRWLARGARLIALAIIIGWSLANVIQRVGDWSLSDMDAYWNAAMRLRDGAPLYPPVADPSAVDIFKYAPWFAWVWMPLTFLPRPIISVAWSAVLVVASGAAISPLLRVRNLTALAAAALLGSILLWSAASGNVQPLLVASLALGVERRSGPVWIGLAASLKIFPIFYALVYLARRMWGRFIVASAIGAVLWAPALLYDLTDYQRGFGDSPNPFLATSTGVYAGVAVVAIIATMLAARTKFAWLAAASGLVALLPRVSLIDLSYLAVGAGVSRRNQSAVGAANGRPGHMTNGPIPTEPGADMVRAT